MPVLVTANIERYTIASDSWEVIEMTQAPQLAAFSWCRIDRNSIVVLGGSDGNILTSDFWEIDFENRTVSLRDTDFDENFPTAMGHLFFNAKSKTLHHIGGQNSCGINFDLKLGQKEWIESVHSHSLLANTKEMELQNNSSLYFV